MRLALVSVRRCLGGVILTGWDRHSWQMEMHTGKIQSTQWRILSLTCLVRVSLSILWILPTTQRSELLIWALPVVLYSASINPAVAGPVAYAIPADKPLAKPNHVSNQAHEERKEKGIIVRPKYSNSYESLVLVSSGPSISLCKRLHRGVLSLVCPHQMYRTEGGVYIRGKQWEVFVPPWGGTSSLGSGGGSESVQRAGWPGYQ